MNNLYKLVPTRRFIKQLKKLDRYTQKLITNTIYKPMLEDPQDDTERLWLVIALVNGAIELNYRVIVQIVDDELVVATLEVGHRRDIYWITFFSSKFSFINMRY